MKIYKCVFTGNELCSDSYPQNAPFDDEELSDVAFEVKSRRVVKGGEDYGITDNSEMDDANGDAGVETVIDIIDTFGLAITGFSKKDFGVYIKGYMQRLKKHLEENKPDRVEPFMRGAQKLIKRMLSIFEELQFYTGESMDEDATMVYSYYKDGEDTPRFIFIKDGTKEEKC
ncbi:putative histamine-releasing factor [Cardiosporidium cionae]|uniref:Histamine-releasing factor n=1 Tax=Cardiosporidium cionae TaxID=476202 RepID=A0ABQ7JAJ6_9APIC|nr:putative histamine-releasing factor [Cardiosporidium cionae]|eukprot:KAF8821033.1 putative histamine-releasing factor [Cardiosporidium cionae]